MLLRLSLYHLLHRELDHLVYRQIHPLLCQRHHQRHHQYHLVLDDFEIYKASQLVRHVLVVNRLNLEHPAELVHQVGLSVEFLLQNLGVPNLDEHLPSAVVALALLSDLVVVAVDAALPNLFQMDYFHSVADEVQPEWSRFH
jgi:hypothetical protein